MIALVKYRWVVPTALGVLAILLGVISTSASTDRSIREESLAFGVGQSYTWTGLALEEGRKYRLGIVPVDGGGSPSLGVGENATVSAALKRDDAAVFELEDSFWHERGTWREGGESGTWEEQNARSEFTFEVPESGSYDLEVRLVSSNVAGTGLSISISWLDHFPLSPWAMFLGGVILLGLGGVAWNNSRTVLAKLLEDVGPGSKIRLGELEWVVLDRAEEHEAGKRIGVELRVRDPQSGATSYLAVDRYEREHPWNEEMDQLVALILREVRLTNQELEKLAALPHNETVVGLRNEIYSRDPENSGPGRLYSSKHGETYVSNFYADSYRPEDFPIAPGDCWLTRTRWSATREEEWTLMEVIDWSSFDVVEFVEAQPIDTTSTNNVGSPFGGPTDQQRDFFGGAPPQTSAANQPFAAPVPTRQQHTQHPQQQPHQHHAGKTGDWNDPSSSD